ncbi:MAG: sodium:proton antiporter [Burkholderiales bacterium]|nr:sodium:proton antiporter [Burkholderiales bacterium]
MTADDKTKIASECGAPPTEYEVSELPTAEHNRLDLPVDARTDHALGDPAADITLVEYGSFNCPSCRAAHAVIANLRDRFGDRLRYVFRHRPLAGNEHALRAAELAEFAQATVGRYWEAHEALIQRGPHAGPADFQAVSTQLSVPACDAEPVDAWHRAQAKVQADIESARRSGARVSPTFFINGRRYDGPWDESALTEAMLGSLGHRVQTTALDFARWAPSTGLLLLAMALVAVAFTNSPLGPGFTALWETSIGWSAGSAAFHLTLREWIDDGLLTIFFLVVGLEIKRELTVGRLASPRAAAFPLAAAAGGMLLPASLYLAIVPAGPLSAGWAIPTTTDTAFAVAVIALLGARVPVELRIFLTAAVIVDDLVAIAIVAVFYSSGLDYRFVAAAIALTALLLAFNRGGVYAPLPYVLVGVLIWSCLHASGLHATLAGVVIAAVTPTRPPANLQVLMTQAENLIDHELRRAGEKVLRHGPSEDTLRALDAIHDRIESPAAKLLRSVEPWSSYFVLPLFALANAGLAWHDVSLAGHEALITAIVVGLVIGKPVGMVLAGALAVRLGIATKPDAYSWTQLLGASALAGIGFTMSLYIASKAFPDAPDFLAAKLGIFLASLLAGVAGSVLLRATRSLQRSSR